MLVDISLLPNLRCATFVFDDERCRSVMLSETNSLMANSERRVQSGHRPSIYLLARRQMDAVTQGS